MNLLTCTLLVSLGAPAADAAAPAWLTDLPQAQRQAKRDNKEVLILFHGSDWCLPCQKMQKEVFTTRAFADYAARRLVLVEADFPRHKEQSAELKRKNQALKEKFSLTGDADEGFPTVVLLDADGKELGRQAGYNGGGAAAFLEQLEKMTTAAAVLAGHSQHGEIFNEGPRQKAYLMGGTGKVHLPVTTKTAEVQAFFDQGVGQLHGFWYFEAERSFRQAAALDPACAMAYWGMAMANVNNPTRAKGFIRQAVDREAGVSRREQMWIDAYAAYWSGNGDDKGRRQELIRRLEDISYEFPQEVEAKAFLAFHIWDSAGHGLPIVSKQAVDALLKEVLAAEPMHPVHHYRIHLWDGGTAARALDSAARCGQSSPNIAHMWHMSGHIYVDLHRYADACWQQEASARVDHRHMMHDRVLPDQIHNYAHNNQWLVEDLEYVGRVHDAVGLAKNLIELPRHPRYNTLGLKEDGTPYDHNFGSAEEGRRRLFETLTRYELWDELIALSDTMYLEPTDLPAEQVKRLRLLGVAEFSKGDAEKGRQQIRALEALKAEASKTKAKTKPDAGAIDAALAELRAYDLLVRGDKAKAAAAFGKVHGVPEERLAQVWLRLGDAKKAEELARRSAAAGDKQVYRLANYVDILHRAGKAKEAKEQFAKLRPLSAEFDLDVPVMRRLAPLAKELGLPADWRVPKVAASDVGVRPSLDDLGPLHWQPTAAPDWTLPDEHGKPVALHDYRGKPVLVLFYLGSGCPHCIAQLDAFEPAAARFAEMGVQLVAVSTDSVAGLRQTFRKSKIGSEFAVVSDQSLRTFKAYRAFDDFENTPLHGTFLIDGSGRVRWQDVSYEPFTDVRFLLGETKRLLSLPAGPAPVRSARGN
ncbi:MAG TPA: redoxin domain-containing protein [Gemmataceae bacterium]|nr:redoxin domain-containing protein [Gemmataceae bacterium]